MDVEWEDPTPSAKGRKSDVRTILEVLRANPGKWAVVRRDGKSSGIAGNLRLYYDPAGEFEWTGRLNVDSDPQTWTVFARFKDLT